MAQPITDLTTLDATILAPSRTVFTLRSKKTQKYFTYELRLSDDGKVRFVGVLTSKGKFATLGTIFQHNNNNNNTFKHNTFKSPVAYTDVRTKAFAWAWAQLSSSATAPGAFAQMDIFEGAPGLYGDHAMETRVFYTCQGCDCTFVLDSDSSTVQKKECPTCSALLKGHKLKATFSTKGHACNASCTHAKGHVCVCSCGGANHGIGHMHTFTAV